MCRVKNIIFSFVASLLFIVVVSSLDLIYKSSHDNKGLAETLKERIIYKKTTKYKFLNEEVAFYINSARKMPPFRVAYELPKIVDKFL